MMCPLRHRVCPLRPLRTDPGRERFPNDERGMQGVDQAALNLSLCILHFIHLSYYADVVELVDTPS